MALYQYDLANKKRDLSDVLSTVVKDEPASSPILVLTLAKSHRPTSTSGMRIRSADAT